MNAIILAGSHIGSNVIVGAGSVVYGDVPYNCVIAGNPAKIISSLDAYYQKRKSLYVGEAKEYVRVFTDYHNRTPQPKEMLGFWPLFMPRDENALREAGIRWNLGGDNADEVLQGFLNTEPLYGSYQEFVDDALNEK